MNGLKTQYSCNGKNKGNIFAGTTAMQHRDYMLSFPYNVFVRFKGYKIQKLCFPNSFMTICYVYDCLFHEGLSSIIIYVHGTENFGTKSIT